jgi:hypothetical protein
VVSQGPGLTAGTLYTVVRSALVEVGEGVARQDCRGSIGERETEDHRVLVGVRGRVLECE